MSTAEPVARVEERDIDHEADEQRGESALDIVQQAHADGTAADGLNERERDVSAIKHGQRQHVQQRKIYIENHAEPQHAPPAVFAFEQIAIDADDHHRTAELLDTDFTFVAEQRAKNIHVHDGISEAEFVDMRSKRDATLEMPVLILPAVQINIRAGELPPKEGNGISYAKIPLNAL